MFDNKNNSKSKFNQQIQINNSNFIKIDDIYQNTKKKIFDSIITDVQASQSRNNTLKQIKKEDEKKSNINDQDIKLAISLCEQIIQNMQDSQIQKDENVQSNQKNVNIWKISDQQKDYQNLDLNQLYDQDISEEILIVNKLETIE